MNKKQKKAKLTLDIIACALSAVSAGLSIAAHENPVLCGETRNKCRTETKKLLTFAVGFGILLKLSLRANAKPKSLI